MTGCKAAIKYVLCGNFFVVCLAAVVCFLLWQVLIHCHCLSQSGMEHCWLPNLFANQPEITKKSKKSCQRLATKTLQNFKEPVRKIESSWFPSCGKETVWLRRVYLSCLWECGWDSLAEIVWLRWFGWWMTGARLVLTLSKILLSAFFLLGQSVQLQIQRLLGRIQIQLKHKILPCQKVEMQRQNQTRLHTHIW